MNRHIYLDNASTTPVDDLVVSAMTPYLNTNYGNPSSLHLLGRVAKQAIENSRSSIASILGVLPSEIIFTSGGTESDNLAIHGLAHAYKHKGKHIIVSSIEHKAILDSCKQLEREGFLVSYVPVDEKGFIMLEELSACLRPDTIVVSIMYANNEVGTIQSITKIANLLKKRMDCSPIFHTDACQAAGALSLCVSDLGVDALSISSSKIYGPKGVGALYLNSMYTLEPVLLGGGQEYGKRSGTENVAGIVGFAKALELTEKRKQKEFDRLIVLRSYFLERIKDSIKDVVINGDTHNRLPNNINISIPGVEGESLVLLLDSYGIYCSTGSACSSLDLSPSHVLLAMNVPLHLAHCSVRFTLGNHTKKSDITYAVKALVQSVTRLRQVTIGASSIRNK